jgi:hypothetical protein
MPIRSFSSQLQSAQPVVRNIDNDAPAGLRHEFIDLVFTIYEQLSPQNIRQVYQIIAQTVGIQPSSNPVSGYRYAASREISQADWPRVYDLVCRFWIEVSTIPSSQQPTLTEQYRTGINRILAAYGIVWDLDQDGVLRRILPLAIRLQLNAAFEELSAPRFARLFPRSLKAWTRTMIDHNAVEMLAKTFLILSNLSQRKSMGCQRLLSGRFSIRHLPITPWRRKLFQSSINCTKWRIAIFVTA